MQVVLLFTVRLLRLQVPAPQLMQLVELCLGTSGLVRPYWKSCGEEGFSHTAVVGRPCLRMIGA